MRVYCELAIIERMLNLNQDKEDDVTSAIEKADAPTTSQNALDSIKNQSQSQWKVLIFDSFGRDIISSVLRVNDLFKVCIFFSLLLSKQFTNCFLLLY